MSSSLNASSNVSSKELRRRDFILNGNLWKVIIVISLPLFLYSILNYVNDVIDNFMCASISSAAVSASASLSQVKNMVSAIGGGLSAGGSIIIAREIGKNNYNKAKSYASTVFAWTAIIGILTCSIVIPLARPLLRMMGVLDSLIDIGIYYFIISIISACLTMFNSVFMGVEKAKGSTVMITVLNIVVMLIKVGLTSLFVYIIKVDDMTYVALATLIANLLLTIFVIIRLSMRNYIFHFSFKNIDFSKKSSKKITFISFPIFLGKFIFSFGKVSINSMAKNYGQTVVGALGISNNIGGMVTNGLGSIEDSSSSIISQNLGNGNFKRAIKTFYYALTINLVLAVIGVLIISIPQINSAIVNLFARDVNGVVDQDFANMISEIFFYEKMGIITLGINSAVLGLLYGFGYTRLSMIINIARVFLFRIPSLWILQNYTDLGYKSVGIAMGFSNICIGIVAIIVAIAIIHRIKKKEHIKEENRVISDQKRQKIDEFIKGYLASFEHYKASKVWCYEDGVVLLGAYDLYMATKDKYYLDFCINYFDKNIGEDGSLIGYTADECNIDNLQAGTALYLVNKIHHEEKYEKAIELLASQLEVQPRTLSGSFWHKKRYPYQIWLDGLYMGEPFYTLIANEHQSSKMKDDIIHQFKNVDEFNYDVDKKLYYHCYDETKSMQWASKEDGKSPNIWLRSVGWLAMAAADVYDAMDGITDVLRRKYLKDFLKRVLSSMEPYQDEKSKMFLDLPVLKDVEGNYIETSGSVMLAYGYLKGARIGMLDFEEIKKGVDIFEGIVNNVLDEKGLGNICQVAGLDNERRDGSVEYYLSEKIVYNDAKGVGPFMMAYSEYIKSIVK